MSNSIRLPRFTAKPLFIIYNKRIWSESVYHWKGWKS